MANSQRLVAWVDETREALDDAHNPCLGGGTGMWWFITKAVVLALLTIAIAIHEAAETKKGK